MELQRATPPFYPIAYYTRSWPDNDPPILVQHQGFTSMAKNRSDVFVLAAIRAELKQEPM